MGTSYCLKASQEFSKSLSNISHWFIILFYNFKMQENIYQLNKVNSDINKDYKVFG